MGCRYCRDYYAKHNKIGCPLRKENVKRIRKEYEEGDKLWYPSILQQDDKYKEKKHRKCSYCFNRYAIVEHDHNRRTCSRLKSDREQAISKNKEWRAAVLVFLKEKGLGAGAIVNDTRVGGLSVITEVYWENLTHLYGNQHSNKGCFELTHLAQSPGCSCIRRLPSHPVLNHGWYNWSSLEEVVVPATGRLIDKSAPKAWIDGTTDLEWFFSIKNDKYV